MSTRPPSETPAAVATTTDSESGLILIDDGNIKKKILKEGTGPTPTDRSDVTVHYTGRLLDGTVFDSSKKRNEPFVFKIGQGQVIKGWDKGVATMRVGEHAILTCSPEYAYGARGSPPTIPPNSTLEFEVELLSFDNTTKVTDDGGVKKSIQQAGTGHNRPNDNATITIKYSGRVKGRETPFVDQMTSPSTFELGTAAALARLPWGLEEGIKNMHIGERANFVVQPAYGFGDKGDAALGIPPGATLEFTVELVDMTKGKEGGEMAFDEKLAYMTSLKEQGNAVFKQGLSYDRACKIYTKAVHVFPYDGALDEEQKKKVNTVKISAMSNNALCKMKQADYDGVVQHATAALAIDPTHVKCLFYRAQAYVKLGKAEEAEADLKAAAAADPANKEVARELNTIKARKRAEAEKEKKAFGGFFNRVKLVSPEEEARAAKEAAEAKARAEAADSSDGEFENDEDEEMPPAAETATTTEASAAATNEAAPTSTTDATPMADTAAQA